MSDDKPEFDPYELLLHDRFDLSSGNTEPGGAWLRIPATWRNATMPAFIAFKEGDDGFDSFRVDDHWEIKPDTRRGPKFYTIYGPDDPESILTGGDDEEDA